MREAILIVAQYLNAESPRDAWAGVDVFQYRLAERFCDPRWSAFAIGWPIAAGTAYLAMPFARSLTQRTVAAIDPRRFRSEGPGLGQFVTDACGDTSIQAHKRAVDRMIR
jgi:hypothetical protein